MTKEHSSKVQLHTTRDGSHTLYSEKFDQYYHNPNGAVSESIHVFFERSGLLEAIRKHESISILEIGFGTGLNLVLLLHFLTEFNYSKDLNFHSIEAFPISSKEAQSLDFGESIDKSTYEDLLPDLFEILKDEDVKRELGNIQLQIHSQLFKEVDLEESNYNFIFFDAFSPEANPDLWTAEVFEKIYEASTDDVVLSTYCAASSARAAMAKAGFYVARAQGALGKREMTIASKKEEKIADFKKLNEVRLIERWDAGEFSSN